MMLGWIVGLIWLVLLLQLLGFAASGNPERPALRRLVWVSSFLLGLSGTLLGFWLYWASVPSHTPNYDPAKHRVYERKLRCPGSRITSISILDWPPSPSF